MDWNMDLEESICLTMSVEGEVIFFAILSFINSSCSESNNSVFWLCWLIKQFNKQPVSAW